MLIIYLLISVFILLGVPVLFAVVFERLAGTRSSCGKEKSCLHTPVFSAALFGTWFRRNCKFR